MMILTLPQQALHVLPLQLTDAEPEEQHTWMPFEHERPARTCVLKRSTKRRAMLRVKDWKRILAKLSATVERIQESDYVLTRGNTEQNWL